MIISGDAGSFEFHGFPVADLTKRHTDFHPELTDFAHNFEDAIELFTVVAHAPPGRAHAKSRRTLCARVFRGRQNLIKRHQIFPVDPGRVMGALGAIGAIFAASSRLYTEQTAALNVLAAPMFEMDRAGLADQIEERLVIEGRDFFEIH